MIFSESLTALGSDTTPKRSALREAVGCDSMRGQSSSVVPSLPLIEPNGPTERFAENCKGRSYIRLSPTESGCLGSTRWHDGWHSRDSGVAEPADSLRPWRRIARASIRLRGPAMCRSSTDAPAGGRSSTRSCFRFAAQRTGKPASWPTTPMRIDTLTSIIAIATLKARSNQRSHFLSRSPTQTMRWRRSSTGLPRIGRS